VLKHATNHTQSRSTQFDQTNKRMNKLQVLKTIKSIGKWIFLLFTIFLVFLYIPALIDKIQRPTFKNLPMNQYVIIGIILLIMIFLNLKWFGIFKTKRIDSKI
tara:strand:+ start:39 stop:347 length:309 start_codon:yes stop_codon:yes gene_type:complete